MDFTFSPEQQELRSAVCELAADRSSSTQVRAAMSSSTPGFDPALWRLVGAEMGLLGVGVDETLGGAGGGFVDAAVVIEEAGRALMPVPLMSTLVASQVLARAGTPGADALAEVLSGEQPAVLAVTATSLSTGGIGFGGAGSALSGTVTNVVDGATAAVVVIATPDGLWLTRAEGTGVTVASQQTLDPTRPQATLHLDRAAAVSLGDADAAQTAVDLLRVALAVEAVGVSRRCLEQTVDYLKTREQFGRVIGSFQALQHRAADIAVEVEAAMSTAYYAAWAAEAAPGELPVVAPLALSVCADAAWHAASESIQLHGGIGFTWEHDAHLYFKRAKSSELFLGEPALHREQLLERIGV